MFDLLFYTFAFLGFLSSVMVISSKNPVHSVFFLILVFCFSFCLLLLLTVDFLSIIFIVVYVGAIAVLFLFVVMMLNIRLAQVAESFIRYIPLSFGVGIVFLSELYYFLSSNINSKMGSFSVDWVYFLDEYTNIVLISDLIYTHYLPVFIMSGLVLLVAMIGTISLTLHHSLNVRRQLVYKQVGRSVKHSIDFYKV